MIIVNRKQVAGGGVLESLGVSEKYVAPISP